MKKRSKVFHTQSDLACLRCGTLRAKTSLTHGQSLRCNECDALLFRYDAKTLDKVIAWSIAGLIFFILANAFDLVKINLLGSEQYITVLKTFFVLIDNGFYLVGMMSFFLVFFFPLSVFLLYLFSALFLKLQKGRQFVKALLLLLSRVQDWNMIDIFFISILVALVKLVGYAQVHLGISFWSLLVFVGIDLYLSKSYPPRSLWEWYDEAFLGGQTEQKSDTKVSTVRCGVCGISNRLDTPSRRCARCGSLVSKDFKDSISKSWAFLITAIIAYIPANIYPMLDTLQFAKKEENTIIGGIIALWEHGSYPIAVIIFIASVVIPILKFLILIYLLVSVKYPIGKDKKVSKHKLYYLTELAGPWSMVDVFVVAILAALIHFANIQIIPGVAATAFALSVFFTLLSAHAFDKRLIKDCR